VTDNVYIGSRLHSNPSQPSANLSTGIIPGARRQVNLSIQYDF
jgi:Fe(3+) dicitrate transport protein